jgi:hypothetical protein
MTARQPLKRIVEKSGRGFKVGDQVPGRPGVLVLEIARTGNFVTIMFGRERQFARSFSEIGAGVPPAVTVHVDDLKVMAEV